MRLEFTKGSSSKFWEPSLRGKALSVRFGRIGTEGQTRVTKFATPAEAKAALAKLVAEKRGKGYKPARNATARAQAPKADPRRDALLALAAELGGAAVAKEVALAASDAPRFLATTKHELFEDPDDWEDEPDLPWLALIEALGAKGRLAEVDWKEAGDEILACLERIGGAPAKRALADAHEPELEARFTDDCLSRFGGLLAAAKLALVQLDKSSDSYALMVVPMQDVATFAKLARAAHQQLVHWDGADFAVRERKRLRKAGRAPTTNAWRQLLAENAHGGFKGPKSVLYGLRHDNAELLARVRAAAPSASPRDRAVISMTLALFDGTPSRIAKQTKDPKLCLEALCYLPGNKPYEVLAAAAILVERLRIRPERGPLLDTLCEVVNLWAEPKELDTALAKLPKGAWAHLASLANAMVERTAPGSFQRGAAYRAVAGVGDATSLELLARAKLKRPKNAITENEEVLMEKIAARVRRIG